MKILEMFGEPVSNGGQESFVINMLTHMETSGLTVDVLTPYYCDNAYYENIIKERGGRLYCLNLPFEPGKSRFNLLKPLKKFLRENAYDVVHIHSGSTSVLAEGAYAAKRAGVKKIIVHSHCAAEKITLKHNIVKFIAGFVLNRCPTHYVACSLVAGQSKFSDKIVLDKLIILKNGVDLSTFAFNGGVRLDMRKKLGFADDEIVLGHVGRFSYQKNHAFLLSVLKVLIEGDAKARLLLIGSGETMDDVVRESRLQGLYDSITFAGNVNNVNDYLQAMDVFLLPSRFEGLPIVGVEAQAAGLPCIFSDKITNEVNLTKNVCYLPIDGDSAPAWARQALSFSALERVDNAAVLKESGFDVNDTAEKLRQIYLS